MREIGFGLVCGMAAAIGAFLIAAWPVQGRPVAAFFPAGSTARTMAAAAIEAGGDLLQINSESAVTVTLGTGKDHAWALYRAGAWLVIDAGLAKLYTSSITWSGR